jgi:hypothetical protein
MSRQTMLVLTALNALAVAALAPTSASAFLDRSPLRATSHISTQPNVANCGGHWPALRCHLNQVFVRVGNPGNAILRAR